MLNLLLITFMFLLVCAPIPMILFGGDADKENEDSQPLNFDDLGQSFISLFIVSAIGTDVKSSRYVGPLR